MSVDRKASFKLPPTTIRNKLVSQEARRKQALEDQKRKRAQLFDANRQLDVFADLSLGQSDDDDDEGQADDGTAFAPASVAPYVSMMEPYQPPNAISGTLKSSQNAEDFHEVPSGQIKRKNRKKGKNRKACKYANKCMYAELLEMSEDNPWSHADGLPENLDTAWVAVGPVPVGKRCLAITHQSSGIACSVPNTTLRSRLLGKILIPRFPSFLPPSTVLDCILDINWRENGILHILDVVKWKGQDICDCEAPFRFWWRDTRLAELGETLIVPSSYTKIRTDIYQFPYPIKLVPIPYYTDTTLPFLSGHIIPLAKTPRFVTVNVPTAITPSFHYSQNNEGRGEDGMHVEPPVVVFGATQDTHETTVMIQSEGLLLYVAEAVYESGTSPLSNWVPIVSYKDDQIESDHPHGQTSVQTHGEGEGPLSVFERLVQRRLQRSNPMVELDKGRLGQLVEVEMA